MGRPRGSWHSSVSDSVVIQSFSLSNFPLIFLFSTLILILRSLYFWCQCIWNGTTPRSCCELALCSLCLFHLFVLASLILQFVSHLPPVFFLSSLPVSLRILLSLITLLTPFWPVPLKQLHFLHPTSERGFRFLIEVVLLAGGAAEPEIF